jgi:DNA-binding MarR family transcriptional regulator
MVQRTPAGEAFGDVLDEVIQLTRLFTAAGEQFARPAGQTLARWLVLGAVEREPATVADVARGLRLARQSVQRVADLLVADDLAAYAENPRHRRAKLLSPTSQGIAVLREIGAAQATWANALGEELGKGALQAVSEQLARVRAAVERAAAR